LRSMRCKPSRSTARHRGIAVVLSLCIASVFTVSPDQTTQSTTHELNTIDGVPMETDETHTSTVTKGGMIEETYSSVMRMPTKKDLERERKKRAHEAALESTDKHKKLSIKPVGPLHHSVHVRKADSHSGAEDGLSSRTHKGKKHGDRGAQSSQTSHGKHHENDSEKVLSKPLKDNRDDAGKRSHDDESEDDVDPVESDDSDSIRRPKKDRKSDHGDISKDETSSKAKHVDVDSDDISNSDHKRWTPSDELKSHKSQKAEKLQIRQQGNPHTNARKSTMAHSGESLHSDLNEPTPDLSSSNSKHSGYSGFFNNVWVWVAIVIAVVVVAVAGGVYYRTYVKPKVADVSQYSYY